MPMIPPYPLAWPEGQPRSPKRGKSAFRTKLPQAIENVRDSLRLFATDSGRKLDAIQVTSNVGLLDGTPADPGVSVWFVWDGAQRCISVDCYLTVAENLQAIHHVLEARRTELRHAGIEMARAAFKGFVAALPAPSADATWWETLGLTPGATAAEVKAAFMRLYQQTQDPQRQRELLAARDKARAIVGEA